MFGWFIGRNKGFQPNTLPDLQLWLDANRIGVQGYSLDFDGTDDFVQANNVITAYPFTLECWVRFDVVTGGVQSCVYLSKTGASSIYWGFGINSNARLILHGRNTTNFTTTGTTNISANTWYHLAGVFTSDTERTLYLNGVLEVTQTDNVAFASASIRVLMGLYRDTSAGNYLNGKLSDVRIWNTARTAQEIADNYQKRLIGNESGLVGYWKLDKGSGTTVTDFTSNANTGTITGAIWDNSEPLTEAISDNTAVRVWADQSGKGYDATQSTTAARPTYRTNQLNGLPAVVFDGTDDSMTLVSGALGLFRNIAGISLFIVARYATATTQQETIFASTPTGGTRFRLFKGTSNLFSINARRLDADTLQTINSSVTNVGNFVVHSALLNYQATLIQQYINGSVSGQSTTFQTSGNTSDTNSNSIILGLSLNGAISEIIVYNRALNTSELAQVHRYLARKWGIQLA